MSEGPPPHRFKTRIYYEDTDLAGVVYYANYLKFIERARTEWLRELGVDQSRLRAESGLLFAVKRCAIEYQRPAVLDDEILVETRLGRLRGASLQLVQIVRRSAPAPEVALAHADVEIVCLGPAFAPTRFPTTLKNLLMTDQ